MHDAAGRNLRSTFCIWFDVCVCARACVFAIPWGIVTVHSCAHQVPHSGPPKIDTLETWKKGRTDIYIIYGLVFFVSQSCCNRQMRAISTYIEILYTSKNYALYLKHMRAMEVHWWFFEFHSIDHIVWVVTPRQVQTSPTRVQPIFSPQPRAEAIQHFPFCQHAISLNK